MGDTGKENDEEDDSFDEGDNFVVPDGYLSESEVQSLDEDEKNIVRKRPDYDKNCIGNNANGGVKSAFVVDFRNHCQGSDVNMDSLLTAFTIINIDEEDLGYPININKDEREIEVFEKEVVIRMAKMLHGKDNKKEVLEEIREDYPNFTHKQIKGKISSMCTFGIWVNHDVFTKMGGSDEEYISALKNLVAGGGGKWDRCADSDNESVGGGEVGTKIITG